MKFSGLLVPRLVAKSVAARSPVDIALFGVGVTTAAASVVFAGVMFTRGDHAPLVYGTQYLGVFGQPHGHVAVVAAAEPARAAPAPAATAATGAGGAASGVADSRSSIDMSPTGSIVRSDDAPESDPYRIVAVEAGMAWLRNSVETRVIKPGDLAPGLGRVAAIVVRDGRWTLLDDSGATLLAADPPEPARAAANPFSRRMIFGGD